MIITDEKHFIYFLFQKILISTISLKTASTSFKFTGLGITSSIWYLKAFYINSYSVWPVKATING